MRRETPESPSDLAEAAHSIQLLLDQIEAGDVDATPEERSRLEGALAALTEIINR